MKKSVRQKKTPDFLQAAFEKIGKCVYIYRKCVKQIEKIKEFQMGQQYNKVQKRARRKRYNERLKARAKAAMKAAKKK
ncbi:MAG TPA: hypothetical protein DDZ11_13845 [Lentisphaeria bacterium]|nr:hypothetical protein [Lentisphaeria bacterium]